MTARSLIERLWRPIVFLAWIGLVASITLRPGRRSWLGFDQLTEWCLICGTRGSADAVLNVVMFAPLGFLIASRGRGVGAAFLCGLVGSVLIEGSQLFLAGRHAGLSDLLWNSSGALVGALLWQAAQRRIVSPRPRAVVGAAGFVAVSLLVGGVLLTPRQTGADYWGQWTPALGYMPQYSGRILDASLSGRPFPSYRLPAEPPHRRLLEDGWELRGSVVVGEAPRAVSPILSIYDRNRQEIVLLGAHRQDLVYRERTLGKAMRFDSPDVRILDGLVDVQPGDTMLIAARREGELCLQINDLHECGAGVTPGRTWGLLLYLEGPPESFRRTLDLLWLMVLFSPIGFWAVGRRGWAWGLAIGFGGGALAVAVTPLVLPGIVEPLAGLLGVVLGAGGAAAGRWLNGETSTTAEPI